jgi:polyhydroxyalkanoate synthase
MKARSSGVVPAPTQPGNARYPVIESAPGSYVKQKSN